MKDAVMTRNSPFAALILIFGLGCAIAVAPSPAAAQGTPEQQQACQPDAMRLCGEFVPDVERITACMVKKRAQLSPACRAVFYHSTRGTKKRRFHHRHG